MFKADKLRPLRVMGLMSGTSVDGVDACLVHLDWQEGQLRFEVRATYTQDMPEPLRQRLLHCMADKAIGLEEFCALNVAVGELFAEAALGLMNTHGIPASQIDCIGSHGQTIYHWPPTQPNQLGGTLQIGEPSIIAEKTGLYTIADFRPADMAAGGQGAPLVCFADQLLFQSDTVGRCVQNIGGIANVTVLPARDAARTRDLPIIAFDTGPGNMLMDAAMSHFYQRPYDESGAVAASGHIQDPLLQHLSSHPYLQQSPPKTTGREQFGEPYFQELLGQFPDITPADWLATLTTHTAQSIADAYARFIFPTHAISELIIGGGGAYNPFLLKTLADCFRRQSHPITLHTHADFHIHDKYKEALAFAILAWTSYCHHPNNLPQCTGASHATILGKHCLPAGVSGI